MLTREAERHFAMVVAKCWIDEGFKKELLANPKQVLEQYDIQIPSYIDVTVKDGSKTGKLEIGIPPKPADIGDDSIEALLVRCSQGTTFC